MPKRPLFVTSAHSVATGNSNDHQTGLPGTGVKEVKMVTSLPGNGDEKVNIHILVHAIEKL
jgi:hypothetical protein